MSTIVAPALRDTKTIPIAACYVLQLQTVAATPRKLAATLTLVVFVCAGISGQTALATPACLSFHLQTTVVLAQPDTQTTLNAIVCALLIWIAAAKRGARPTSFRTAPVFASIHGPDLPVATVLQDTTPRTNVACAVLTTKEFTQIAT